MAEGTNGDGFSQSLETVQCNEVCGPRTSARPQIQNCYSCFEAGKGCYIYTVMVFHILDMKAAFVLLQEHCLIDLLHKWQDGRLPVEITCVIRSTFWNAHAYG